MDLLSAGIGALVGIVVVLLMVELGMKKILPWAETSRLTSVWDLNDLKGTKPLMVVAENIEGLALPRDSLVVVKEEKALPRGMRAGANPRVNSNFVVGEDRALIFTSSLRPNVPVIWTTNDKIIAKLISEFNRFWSEVK